MVSPAKLSPIEVRRLMVVKYGVGVYPSKDAEGRVDLKSRWDFHLRTGNYPEADEYRRKCRQSEANLALIYALHCRHARTSVIACAFAVSPEAILKRLRSSGMTAPRSFKHVSVWNRVYYSRQPTEIPTRIMFSIGDAFQVVNRQAAQHGRAVIEAGDDHAQAQAPAG